MTASAAATAVLDDQAAQRRALSRHRWLATGLLLFMAALWLATRLVPDPGFLVLLVRAGAEAAMVGGLADWFAVTALFRHPLGIPIPHTAIVPRSKDRIGEGLGQFVERNFLDPELVANRLQGLDIAGRLGRWLSNPDSAEKLAGRITGALPHMLDSITSRALRRFFSRALKDQLERVDLAPILGRGLAFLRETDRHHQLFDYLLRATAEYIDEEQERIYEMVEARSHWWIPKTIDRRIAAALINGILDLLEELSDPEHSLRLRFDGAVDQLIHDLCHSPEMREKVRRVKDELLENPETQNYLNRLWDELRKRILTAAENEDSDMRHILARAIRSVGHALLRDTSSAERLNDWIARMAREFVTPWRHEIGDFIADVVKSWDGRSVAQRIELGVGRDLQYIRINGTLVGALVGCMLFLISHLLF
ncbi:MAG TPA: DUF445 domain-containing protein [Sphingomonadales bacterium]